MQNRTLHRGRLFLAAAGLLLLGGLSTSLYGAQKKHGFWKFLAVHTTHNKADSQQAPAGSPPKNEKLTSLSLEQLGDIKVTSVSKKPEEVWRTPAAIYVITQEDIRRSGATSIPEVLRLAPGVEVSRIDSNHWAIGIRGFGSQFSRSLLVLIDGRSVYTPLFAGVYWNIQNVMLQDVDRIEVIRGPGGTIWGSNAVNGVINIITKSAKETHGALASVGGGNVDQGSGGVRYGTGNGKGFDYRVYGEGFTRGPEFHPDGRNYDDWRTGQAGFRTDWDSSPGNTWTLQGDAYNGDDGEVAAYGSYSPPAQIQAYGNAEVSGGNILGRWQHKFSERSDIRLQAYVDRTSRSEPQFGEVRNTFDFDFLHHLKLWRGQDFSWGLGARWSAGDFTQVVPTVAFTPNDLTFKLYSGFVQDVIPIVGNKLALTVGSKLEHNSYTGFEAEPTARLLWTPTPRQTLWAAVTRAVRTPSRIDEDLSLEGFLETVQQVPVFVQITGSRDFVSERLTGYEAGYRTLVTPRLYLDIAAFHNNYNDLSSYGAGSVFIASPPLRIVINFPFANGITGHTDGFEIAPDWELRPWWHLKGSYSFLNMNLKNRAGNTDTGTLNTDEGSSPRHEFVIQSLFNLPKRMEFDQTVRYMSALPAQAASSYVTADVRLGWRATSHLEFSLSGQNLLQPRHVEFAPSAGVPVEIKRSGYGEITFRW